MCAAGAPLVLILLTLALSPAASAQRLGAELVANGFIQPTFATAPYGETERIFVGEKNTGLVRIIRDGQIVPEPFLDVSNQISTIAHAGLLNMAFHPDYWNNGLFYIAIGGRNNRYVVARFRTDPNNPDRGMINSIQIILDIENWTWDHYGSGIAFGPNDGYLYISCGDGQAIGGDPNNVAQNLEMYQGKILRVDVDGGTPYSIPPDNPFVNDPNALPEIWALGVRQPWRISFDRVTGDFYFGDVGQEGWEEINFQRAGAAAGRNYGWRLQEGPECYNPPEDCDPNGVLIAPMFAYDHSFRRCSVTGGYAYRGDRLPLYHGAYFFGDFCTGEVWMATRHQRQTDIKNIKHQIDPTGAEIRSLASFGEDGRGELLMVEHGGGEIWRLTSEMRLDISPLQVGEQVTATVTNAPPDTRVSFFFSRHGPGEWEAPQLGVTMAIDYPILMGTRRSNASGVATLIAETPARAAGRRLWFQAAVQHNTTEVISGDVAQ
ncbi:MAG: PQQ-dependent sugar dehydrogenase [Phycisphaerales bacterium]